MFSALVPLLVPIVTAVIGAIALMLKDRRRARDSRAIRARALSEATAQVEFATDWWKAQQLLGADDASDANRKLRAWLAKAETTAEAARQLHVNHNAVTFRRLFLLKPMHRTSSRILRILFWISAVWLVAGAAVTASDVSSHGKQIGDEIGGMVFFAVITILLHVCAEATDHSDARPGPDRLSDQTTVAVAADSAVVSHAALPADGAALMKSV